MKAPPAQYAPRKRPLFWDDETRRENHVRRLEDARWRLQAAMMTSGMLRQDPPRLTLCRHEVEWTSCDQCSKVSK